MSIDVGAEPSHRIAAFIESLQTPQFIPEGVYEAARSRLVDTLAVGIAGSSTEVSARIRASLLALGGAGHSRVWGTDLLLAPAAAALANAAATHSEDYDDTHTGAVVHGSVCVIPAVWAAAESSDLRIADVRRGVIAGWEVGARLGLASDGAFHRQGLHTTSVVGVFAAAAGVAAAWHLDEAQTVSALGLAASASGGMNVYLLDGTQGKLLNPGFAAQAGLQAAALAAAGVAGPSHAFDGRAGLYDSLGEGVPDLDVVFGDLGRVWEIDRVSVKPFPACHFAHATIDAALELRSAGLEWQCIASIQCRLPEATWDLLCRPWVKKLEPDSAYAVKFSIPWLLALALIDGNIRRETFAADVLARQEVRDLATKVTIDPWRDSPFPHSFPGSISVHTKDGRQLEATRLINRGHPDNPLTEAELSNKVAECLEAVSSSAGVTSLIAMVSDPGYRTRDVSAALVPNVLAPLSIPTMEA